MNFHFQERKSENSVKIHFLKQINLHDFWCGSAQPVLFTHCQKRDFGAKNRSVLSKILIGFCGNPLELGKIGGDSRTRIFTAFSIQRGAESLETRRFSGYCTFSYLPSNSARFGFHHLTRNAVYVMYLGFESLTLRHKSTVILIELRWAFSIPENRL